LQIAMLLAMTVVYMINKVFRSTILRSTLLQKDPNKGASRLILVNNKRKILLLSSIIQIRRLKPAATKKMISTNTNSDNIHNTAI